MKLEVPYCVGDATAVWQATLAQARANGGAYITFTDPFTISGQLDIDFDNVTIDGCGVGSIAMTSSAPASIFSVKPAAMVPALLADDEETGAGWLKVTDPASWSVGDYAVLVQTTLWPNGDRSNWALVSPVIAISAPFIQLLHPLPFYVTRANGYQFYRMTPRKRVSIINASFDGAGQTGYGSAGSHGVESLGTVGARFENLSFRNYHWGNGLRVWYSYRDVIRNVALESCGTISGASFNDLSLTYATMTTLEAVRSLLSNGFGPGVEGLCYCDVANVGITKPNGRGFKWIGSIGNRARGVYIDWGPTTQLALVWGCQNNVFSDVVIRNGGIGNQGVGIWTNNASNTKNQFLGVDIAGMAGQVIETGASDTGQLIEGNVDSTLMSNNGNAVLKLNGSW